MRDLTAIERGLRSTSPTRLGDARAEAHRAIQLVAQTALANLEPAGDDSHTNFGWSPLDRTFRSQPLETASGERSVVALSLVPLALALERNQRPVARLDLAGRSIEEAQSWLDDSLIGAELHPTAGIELPYELPAEVIRVQRLGHAGATEGLPALASWFDLIHSILVPFMSDIPGGDRPADPRGTGPRGLSPSPIRCWPHHFDLATFVSVTSAATEGAGVGIGLSPGDENYAQPYIYVNAWPHLADDGLPDIPAPGRWHTDEFVGAVATGEEILEFEAPCEAVEHFIRSAFDVSLERMER